MRSVGHTSPSRAKHAQQAFRLALMLGGTIGVLAISVRPTQDAVASGFTRSITIYHAHTKEQETVTFKRGGSFDSAGLQKLNWLLRDWRADEPTRMDPNLFDLLWEVHRAAGSNEPIHVVSAYRSPGTNAMLRRRSSGVARHSLHMSGQALDFNFPDVSVGKIRDIGLRMQAGGVGYYPRANNPWVHLDTGGVRHWPKVTREHLVRLFPDEKTVHIPRDGKPLAGFEIARASIEARGGSVSSGYIDIAEGRATGRSLFQILFGGGEEEEEVAPRGRGRTAVAARQRRAADTQQMASVQSDTGGPSAVAFFNQNTTTTSTAPMAAAPVRPAPPSRPTPLPEPKEEPAELPKASEEPAPRPVAVAAAPVPTRMAQTQDDAPTGRAVTVPLPLRRPASLMIASATGAPVLVQVPLPVQRPPVLLAAATSVSSATDAPTQNSALGRSVSVPLPVQRPAALQTASLGLRTGPIPTQPTAFAPSPGAPANPLASGPGNAFDRQRMNSLVANVAAAEVRAQQDRVAPPSVTSLVNPQGVTSRFGEGATPAGSFSSSSIRPLRAGFNGGTN